MSIQDGDVPSGHPLDIENEMDLVKLAAKFGIIVQQDDDSKSKLKNSQETDLVVPQKDLNSSVGIAIKPILPCIVPRVNIQDIIVNKILGQSAPSSPPHIVVINSEQIADVNSNYDNTPEFNQHSEVIRQDQLVGQSKHSQPEETTVPSIIILEQSTIPSTSPNSQLTISAPTTPLLQINSRSAVQCEDKTYELERYRANQVDYSSWKYFQQFMLLEGEASQKTGLLGLFEPVILKTSREQIELHSHINQLRNRKPESIIPFQIINKLKIYSEEENGKNFPVNIYCDRPYRLNASYTHNYRGLPVCYMWFATFVTLRLMLTPPRRTLVPVVGNLVHLKEYTKGEHVIGVIYKKSQYKGKWQKRLTIINPFGLYSFKDETQSSPSFVINSTEVKCFGTKFEIQHGYLLIKIRYGKNIQTEFGIPISNFMVYPDNWLFAFYRLMSQQVLPNVEYKDKWQW